MKLEKLYDLDLLQELLFKNLTDLKPKISELGEKINIYIEKFVEVKKITHIQLDAIKSICDSVLKKDKNNIFCLNLKSIIYYYLKNYVEALKNVNSSLKINMDQFDANFIMSNILFEKENFDLALKFVNKAISLIQDSKICYLLKGMIFFHTDKFTEAVTCFDKVLEIDISNLNAMNHKSLALLRMNRIDEALALSNSVLAISQDNLFALINKGLILSKKQEYEEAIEVFNKYAIIRRDIRILTHLKNCYQKIGNAKKVTEYEKEIKTLTSQKRKADEDTEND